MGPKRADNATKGSKASQGNIIPLITLPTDPTTEQVESQQCVGKFAVDLELCCREPPPAYPVPIPVYIRGQSRAPPPPPPPPQISSQILLQPSQSQMQQHSGTHSGTSITPLLMGTITEEQLSSTGKKTSRSRVASVAPSGVFVGAAGIESESRPLSVLEEEPLKISPSPYKTFHLIDDIDFFRPKLLTDIVSNETDSIDQITTLYMKAWQLDQHFIDILKRVLPLQEQLHTLNFNFVGLNQQTFSGFVELCQGIKSLKSVSLDGNPLASEYFHLLIENDDSKILNLSLRFCNITDTNAERLANALGNMSKQNWRLLTLNLSGNQIGDNGGKSFATALRYNRTLISLNLSSNFLTDKSGILLALVLRKIVLTQEEIVHRRYLLSKRYAETHPDEWRYTAISPTPSNFSTKSKSGRESRVEWKRFTDPNKRKLNSTKIAQIIVDKRNRPESEEHRPSSGRQSDLKRGRNEGSTSRSTVLNVALTTGNTSRRPAPNTLNTNTKESDQSRTAAPVRVKKIAAAVNAASKKSVSKVKEEAEDTLTEEDSFDMLSPEESNSIQNKHTDRENPLYETNQIETHDDEIWLKGNFVLINLNLSRNHLTMDTVKEFLLSVQQQSALTHFSDALNMSSSSITTTTPSLMDFSGLCRLELKGMNDISIKSSDYQSLETILTQKNPSTRFQQFKERETKELLDQQSTQSSQQLQPSVPDKTTNISEKTRAGTILKSTNQRPSSRSKD
ncbi:unnamed protein product [Adineta steineri]|uniref:Uncharacterized protein n=3 Tax=Adineta steineri TaxID=433720 RepID=A0A818RGX3_9BILA|nr:unnamed protein product [Adineta steineri]